MTLKLPDDLTDAERRYLAMHARAEAERQYDARAKVPVADREPNARRWREIADTLHRDPWGEARQ